MLRLLGTVVICVLLGSALGWVQHRMSLDGYNERFTSSRASLGSTATIQNTEALPETPVAETIVKAPATGVPKIEVQGGTTFDFGSMAQGSTKKHTFMVKNIGTAPLSLEVGESTCRCTIGSLEKSSLEPGEETGIKLEWTASGVLNEFGQTANIKTNDPDHTNLALNIRGLVAKTMVFDPADLNLGDISATSEQEKIVMLFSYFEKPVKITEIKWGDDKTADRVSIDYKSVAVDPAAFPRHNAAKEATEIVMKVKPGMPLGPINSRLRVMTDNPGLTDLEVSVTGKVAGDIQLIAGQSFNPDNNILSIGKVDRKVGTSLRMHLAIQGPDRETIVPEIESAIPGDNSLKVTVGKPLDKGSRRLYPIICEVPKDAEPANHPGTNSKNYGKIVIKTNHPHLRQIPIFLRLVIE